MIAGEKFSPKDSLFLVNLEEDPGEQNNLANQFPVKVDELKTQYREWNKRNSPNNDSFVTKTK